MYIKNYKATPNRNVHKGKICKNNKSVEMYIKILKYIYIYIYIYIYKHEIIQIYRNALRKIFLWKYKEYIKNRKYKSI